MEETVRFEEYCRIRDFALRACGEELEAKEPKLLHPIILAYVGDAVFSLYVRMRLVPVSTHVQVLHNMAARMVSAVMQARAMEALEPELTEEEAAMERRGRNTKSTVPKSASVREYRMSTAFETLMGYLYLSHQDERLEELLRKSFEIVRKAAEAERGGRKR
ncbi:MAG: ribonuclease III [Acidaminococcus sp.]|nr:ribonuclease III [Acidaminococcus sp.]